MVLLVFIPARAVASVWLERMALPKTHVAVPKKESYPKREQQFIQSVAKSMFTAVLVSLMRRRLTPVTV